MTRAHQRHDRLQKARREIAANHYKMSDAYANDVDDQTIIAKIYRGVLDSLLWRIQPTTKTNNAL